MKKEYIKGGLADNLSNNQFNKSSLKQGQKVELEHTNNKKIATEISKDHLSENSKYYEELEKMEKKLDRKIQLKGTYKGFKYELDSEGYGYKIFNEKGGFGEFQPYAGNRVFDIGSRDLRIKEMRKQLYNAVNRENYNR